MTQQFDLESVESSEAYIATRDVREVVSVSAHLGACLGGGPIYPQAGVYIEDIIHLGGNNSFFKLYRVMNDQRIPILFDKEIPTLTQVVAWTLRRAW